MKVSISCLGYYLNRPKKQTHLEFSNFGDVLFGRISGKDFWQVSLSGAIL